MPKTEYDLMVVMYAAHGTHHRCAASVEVKPSNPAPFHYPIRRLILRSRDVSKPGGLYLDCMIVLKFDRNIGSPVVIVPVKYRSNAMN